MSSPETAKLNPTQGEAPAPAEPRFLGIRPEDWAKTAACLVVLYLCTACVFAGLMSVASEVRQEEWLSLPNAYFGDFVKIEYPVNNVSTYPEEWRLIYQKSNKSAKWNRPEGCELVKDSTTEYVCHGEKAWNVYPWVHADNTRDCTATKELESGVTFNAGVASITGNYAGFASVLTLSDAPLPGLWATDTGCYNAQSTTKPVVTFTDAAGVPTVVY